MDLDDLCDSLQSFNPFAEDNEYFELMTSNLLSHKDMPLENYQKIEERYRRYLQGVSDWGEHCDIEDSIYKYLNSSNYIEKFYLSEYVDINIIKIIDGLNDPRFSKVLDFVNKK
jgi:hypothetical protein